MRNCNNEKEGVVKDKFQLPKNKAVKFDGDKLWFEVGKDEAKGYRHEEDTEIKEEKSD